MAATAAVAAGVVVGCVRSTGFYWHDDYQHLIISRLALALTVIVALIQQRVHAMSRV